MILVARVDCNDGVASHIETLVKGLKSKGVSVVMVSGPVNWDDETEVRYREIAEAIDEWIVLKDLKSKKPSLSDLKEITRMVRRHSVEIIHAHGFGVLPLTLPARIITGVRSVVTFHPSAHADRPTELRRGLGQARSLSYRSLLRLTGVRQVIAYSQEIEDFFVTQLGLSKGLIVRTPLGIDNDYFRPGSVEDRYRSRVAFGFTKDDFVVSLVGRMSWNKGQDVLIDAIAALNVKAAGVVAKALFSGSGYQAEDIKSYAEETLGPERPFHFASFAKDLRPIYWASDLFVMPSRNEGFGLAAVEAMACGLPVIRTPSGGARDQIVEGQNGFIIDFDSPMSLAEKIELLRRDRPLLNRLAENAIATVKQKFTIARMVEETLIAYQKAIVG
jgi:glycosyltransferase involved in cell wall biosynthesis